MIDEEPKRKINRIRTVDYPGYAGCSSRTLAKPPHISLQSFQCPSAASSMLHLKHSQVVPGSPSLTQLMGLMMIDGFLSFVFPLPDVKRKKQKSFFLTCHFYVLRCFITCVKKSTWRLVLETLLLSGFFEVSSSNDVLSTAAAKPRAATYPTPQQSCCVWFL